MNNIRWMTVFLALTLVAGASARAESNEWEFSVAPYLWGVDMNGEAGVGDVRTDIDIPLSRILETLEMGFMLGVEARKGRWGLLADGIYMKLSDDSATPGPFFNTIDTTVENGTLDLALAYRLVEADTWWLDVLVGARYLYLSTEFELTPDYEAVDEISASIVDRVVETARREVEDRLVGQADEIAAELAVVTADAGAAARQEVIKRVPGGYNESVDSLLNRIDQKAPPNQGTDVSLGEGRGTVGDAIRDRISEGIQDRLDEIGNELRNAIADAVKERIDAKFDEIQGNAEAIKAEIRQIARESLAELKSNASSKVANALDKAEKELALVIEDAMTKVADADIEESKEWVDPYVGLRGRILLSKNTFIGARADIGGFGVGSDLMVQLFGGIGYTVNSVVDLELGWRYLSVDYSADDFLYDVAYSGPQIGASFKF